MLLVFSVFRFIILQKKQEAIGLLSFNIDFFILYFKTIKEGPTLCSYVFSKIFVLQRLNTNLFPPGSLD